MPKFPITVNYDKSRPPIGWIEVDKKVQCLIVSGVLKLEPGFVKNADGSFDLLEISLIVRKPC